MDGGDRVKENWGCDCKKHCFTRVYAEYGGMTSSDTNSSRATNDSECTFKGSSHSKKIVKATIGHSKSKYKISSKIEVFHKPDKDPSAERKERLRHNKQCGYHHHCVHEESQITNFALSSNSTNNFQQSISAQFVRRYTLDLKFPTTIEVEQRSAQILLDGCKLPKQDVITALIQENKSVDISNKKIGPMMVAGKGKQAAREIFLADIHHDGFSELYQRRRTMGGATNGVKTGSRRVALGWHAFVLLNNVWNGRGVPLKDIHRAYENKAVLLGKSCNITAGPVYSGYDYTDAEQLARVVSILVPIMFGAVVIIGLVGNALVVIVVLMNRQMRNTTNMLIINLAIADLLFIIFCVPFTATDYSTSLWPFGDVWCRIVQYLILVCAYMSVYTLVLMSVDRYLAVVHPISSMSIRTEKNAIIAIVLMWVTILVFCIPVIATHGNFKYIFMYREQSQCAFLEKYYNLKAFQMSFFLSSYVIPLTLITFLYIQMLNRLWRGVGVGGHISSESLRAKKRVTLMVVIVVVVFAVCWMPIHLILVLKSFNLYKLSKGAIYAQIVSHTLAYANSCVNPILYAFLSENFRKSFHKVIACNSGQNGLNARGQRLQYEGTDVRARVETEGEKPYTDFGTRVLHLGMHIWGIDLLRGQTVHPRSLSTAIYICSTVRHYGQRDFCVLAEWTHSYLILHVILLKRFCFSNRPLTRSLGKKTRKLMITILRGRTEFRGGRGQRRKGRVRRRGRGGSIYENKNRLQVILTLQRKLCPVSDLRPYADVSSADTSLLLAMQLIFLLKIHHWSFRLTKDANPHK
ncbi:Allatostatin-A receptor [Nymphon striatum]|nr:Allatostatin-A receptor [Nymphon striatum]